jgi:ribonuclease HI
MYKILADNTSQEMSKHNSLSKVYPGKSVDRKSTDFFISKSKGKSRRQVLLLFDGLYRSCSPMPNGYYPPMHESHNGLITYGWMIEEDHRIIGKGFGAHNNFISATSNAAEYFALIHGLEALLDMGYEKRKILIRGDSRTVIDQMQYSVSVSSASIRPVFEHAQTLAAQFHHLKWHWIPRKYNKASDRLTRKALKQYRYFANQDYLEKRNGMTTNTVAEECRNPLFDLNIYNPRQVYYL